MLLKIRTFFVRHSFVTFFPLYPFLSLSQYLSFSITFSFFFSTTFSHSFSIIASSSPYRFLYFILYYFLFLSPHLSFYLYWLSLSLSLHFPPLPTSPPPPSPPSFQTRGNERGVLIHGSRDNITAVKPRLSPKPRAPDSRPLYGCHTTLASRTISGGVEAASSWACRPASKEMIQGDAAWKEQLFSI